MARWCFPGGISGKEPACWSRRRKRCRFDPWVGKFPWSRTWQPIPIFLFGEPHGHRSLVGYGPRGQKQHDTWLKRLSAHTLKSPVIKNPPSNGGDEHSIPGQGTKIPHASGQLSLNATTREPTLYNEKILISKLKKKKDSEGRRAAPNPWLEAWWTILWNIQGESLSQVSSALPPSCFSLLTGE